MCSCLRGVSRWFTPLACGPGSPASSKSYMDMASKLFTFTPNEHTVHSRTPQRQVQHVRFLLSHSCLHTPALASWVRRRPCECTQQPAVQCVDMLIFRAHAHMIGLLFGGGAACEWRRSSIIMTKIAITVSAQSLSKLSTPGVTWRE